MTSPTHLTVGQVAERLQVTKQTVYRWIWAGKLRAVKIGGAVRVREEDLPNHRRSE